MVPVMTQANQDDAGLGLTSAEAARRLRQFGPNAMPDENGRGFGVLLREILTEPMLLLLVLAAALYLALGDLGEGIVLAIFALVTIGLVIYQRRRSENALAALKALADEGTLPVETVAEAIVKLGIDPEKPNPLTV